MKKVGFIITTHYDSTSLIKSCLESILKYSPKDSYYIVYANENKSKYVSNIPKLYNNVECIYIKDQVKNNGLTGTWNQGIDKCIKNNCEVIVICNHDLIVNNTLKNILIEASKCINNKLEYYGPCNLKNNMTKTYSRANPNKNRNIKNLSKKYLVGFFMVFPKHVLIKNKLNKKEYFDNNYPFGGNEKEWYNRFRRKNGKGYIICTTKVDHKALKSWKKIGKIMKNKKQYMTNSLINQNMENNERLLNKSKKKFSVKEIFENRKRKK
jgi:hypothetical protein